MITDQIQQHIDVIKCSLDWAVKFNKTFSQKNDLAVMRRRLKTIKSALDTNCSAVAYGESQVGKSYLMSALLSNIDAPFTIYDGQNEVVFVDAINPSGGANGKNETTGVITRFSVQENFSTKPGYVRLELFTIPDLVMLLVDAYYNDIKTDTEKAFPLERVNTEANALPSSGSRQEFLDEDDIANIAEYVREYVGQKASDIIRSNWASVAGSKISNIDPSAWKNVFSILWNDNAEFNKLFVKLITFYQSISFTNSVVVPFDAIKRESGSLLDITWLNGLTETDNVPKSNGVPSFKESMLFTNVFDVNYGLLRENFPKSILSALVREVVINVPKEKVGKERDFLNSMDLLDFPGARSRMQSLLENDAVGEQLNQVFRRGKVAFLLNKYSRELRIASLLFCHHKDQNEVKTLSGDMRKWIELNIGKTPEQRNSYLMNTGGISPLFFVATKFNMDLEYVKTDVDKQSLNHWARFDKTYSGQDFIPDTWFNNWNGRPFNNMYLLRDYYYSRKANLFEGYNDAQGQFHPETSRVNPNNYNGDYWNDLKESFVENAFVRQHFENPTYSWDNATDVCKDGSQLIIKNLNAISKQLDEARKKKLLKELYEMQARLKSILSNYYDSSDPAARNDKSRRIIGNVRLMLDTIVGDKPYMFGRILDSLMISSDTISCADSSSMSSNDVYDLAYRIIKLKSEKPDNQSQCNIIRSLVGINPSSSRSESIQKLCSHYLAKSEDELDKTLQAYGTTLEEVLNDDGNDLCTTEAALVSKRAIEMWIEHINNFAGNIRNDSKEEQANAESGSIDGKYEIVIMFTKLIKLFNIRQKMTDKIQDYITLFENSLESACYAIADYIILTFNDLVSTVGYELLSSSKLEDAKMRISSLGGNLSSEVNGNPVRNGGMNMTIVEAFDVMKRTKEIRQKSDTTLLKSLPLWKNYEQWRDRLTIGLVVCSDISDVNPVENDSMGEIIRRCDAIYTN